MTKLYKQNFVQLQTPEEMKIKKENQRLQYEIIYDIGIINVVLSFRFIVVDVPAIGSYIDRNYIEMIKVINFLQKILLSLEIDH